MAFGRWLFLWCAAAGAHVGRGAFPPRSGPRFLKKDAKTDLFRETLEIVYTAEGAARDARDDVGILTHS